MKKTLLSAIGGLLLGTSSAVADTNNVHYLNGVPSFIPTSTSYVTRLKFIAPTTGVYKVESSTNFNEWATLSGLTNNSTFVVSSTNLPAETTWYSQRRPAQNMPSAENYRFIKQEVLGD